MLNKTYVEQLRIKQLLSIKNKPCMKKSLKTTILISSGKRKSRVIENIRKGLTLKEIIKNSNNKKSEWYINI